MDAISGSKNPVQQKKTLLFFLFFSNMVNYKQSQQRTGNTKSSPRLVAENLQQPEKDSRYA